MSGQTGPKRSPIQREKDLVETARRYLQGESQFVIAAALGVSQPQISHDLRILQRRWQDRASVDIGEAKARELAKIDELEKTHWNAWFESLKEATTMTTRKRSGEKGGSNEASLRREQRHGNPAFLEGVERCIQLRCRIMGLEAPQKIDITTSLRRMAMDEGLDPDMVVAEAMAILRVAK